MITIPLWQQYDNLARIVNNDKRGSGSTVLALFLVTSHRDTLRRSSELHHPQLIASDRTLSRNRHNQYRRTLFRDRMKCSFYQHIFHSYHFGHVLLGHIRDPAIRLYMGTINFVTFVALVGLLLLRYSTVRCSCHCRRCGVGGTTTTNLHARFW